VNTRLQPRVKRDKILNNEVTNMPKDYSVRGTTKIQREKYVNDAISIAVLDAPEPSAEAKRLMRDYIDGKREIDEVLKLTIDRYKVNA
jgi:hypothetical protein